MSKSALAYEPKAQEEIDSVATKNGKGTKYHAP
jgi:hypothetical protein